MTPSLFPDDEPPELDAAPVGAFEDGPGEPTQAELDTRPRCGFCGERGCRHIRCLAVLRTMSD